MRGATFWRVGRRFSLIMLMGEFTARRLVVALLLAVLAHGNPISALAQSALYGTDVVPEAPSGADSRSSSEAFRPAVAVTSVESASARGVDWGGLARDSFLFLAVENAFRCATEQGTRDGLSHPFFQGYLNSVGNLHGWGDGDPFYVNYVGHPMQGAVSGDSGPTMTGPIAILSSARIADIGKASYGRPHTLTSIAFCSRLGPLARPPSATFRLSTRHRGLSTMLSHR